MKYALLVFALFASQITLAQDIDDLLDEGTASKDPVTATFKTTRIINAHSVQTLAKRSLDFRVAHRFGDINGGTQTFFGLDNVTDVRIAFEYGATDKLTLGLGRSKGASTIRSVVDGHIKYALLQQTEDNSMPLSVTLLGVAGLTYMERGPDSTDVSWLPEFKHRLAYTSQILIARKFSENFSLQLMPTYIHRNYVLPDDENGFFAMGIGGRLKFTPRFGLIADYFYLLSDFRNNDDTYFHPLSVGLEIETGGHIFHVNFTNSKGILENDFLSNTRSDWTKGEVSFGFNISRIFYL